MQAVVRRTIVRRTGATQDMLDKKRKRMAVDMDTAIKFEYVCMVL
jgi:hypothetical protein